MGSGVDIVVLGVDISILVLNALGLSVDISVLVSNAPVCDPVDHDPSAENGRCPKSRR